jgi:membrane-bound lytic murein transglycosylase D
MLKSNVPFCFCSVAFIVALPSAANPGPPSFETGKNVHYTTSTAKLATPKTNKISLPLPGNQGMKFVHAYIKNNDECLVNVKERSEGPFSIIDSVLRHYGLPLELKYLAVIESELKPTALSRVGAKGPWQLMPGTAHELGLKVNRRSDERINFYKSTRAAAKYLRDLHREFGDWLLVLAAYNGGPRPVYKAIHKAHSRNFWALQNYLPAESRMHVKKFIATAYYFEGTDSIPSPPVAAMTAPMKSGPVVQESANDRFNRLMQESARSLKESNDLLGVPAN